MDFTMGLPIITNLSLKTRKNICADSCFQKKVDPIDLWFFPKQKYGSKGLAKNANGVVCALLRFLIEKLLFCYQKLWEPCTHLSLGARNTQRESHSTSD